MIDSALCFICFICVLLLAGIHQAINHQLIAGDRKTTCSCSKIHPCNGLTQGQRNLIAADGVCPGCSQNTQRGNGERAVVVKLYRGV